ncbi:chorismate mutase [Mycobacterium sp. LTG2003]
MRARVWSVPVVCVVGALAAIAAAPAAAGEPQSPLVPLVDAATQRLQTADQVAAYKFKMGGPIDDPVREQQVIDSVTAMAQADQIDPAYVGAVFRNQIDATASVEHTRFAQWKLDPDAAPATAPDLADTRKTIDHLNQVMVHEMAAQWSVLHSPACTTDLDNAIRSVVTARALDSVFQPALAYATRPYCR